LISEPSKRADGLGGARTRSYIVALIAILVSIGGVLTLLAPAVSAQATVTVSTPNTNVANVSIKNFAYNPGNITVVIGVNNTVVWTNTDNVNHTVVALDNSYSATIIPNGTFTHTYSVAGVYNYHCTIHTFMKVGSVKVLAGPSTSTSSSTGAVPEFPFEAAGVVVVTVMVLALYAVLRQTKKD
jgi:plastocyanin